MTADEINTNVRNLIRQAMGMPNGSVRMSNDMAPMGSETTEIATVEIIHAQDLGEPNIKSATNVNSPASQDEIVELPRQFVASVQFWKTATPDSAGRAVTNDSAFTRAMRLPLLLGLSANLATMVTMGLGFLRASAPRNLNALVDANWESRGSVDLTFNVIARESAPVDTIASVPVTIQTQDPDQTRTFEVSAP